MPAGQVEMDTQANIGDLCGRNGLLVMHCAVYQHRSISQGAEPGQLDNSLVYTFGQTKIIRIDNESTGYQIATFPMGL